MNTEAVVVEDLVKVYPRRQGGSLTAVDSISFTVSQGEIFGFLGPNGAGKTTTLEIIEGLKSPTSGTVRVLGIDVASDPAAVRSRIGVQLQKEAFLKKLRLEELLTLFGSFYETRADPAELLARVGLVDKRKEEVEKLSGGQARRFAIAAALVNDPQVVFLDEPSSGLDPQARRHLWELILEIKRGGTSVVLTTHYMEEAEHLCDRVAIMDNGQIKAMDTPLALVRTLEAAYRISFTASGLDASEVAKIPGAGVVSTSTVAEGIRFDIDVKDPVVALPKLDSLLSRKASSADDLQISPSTLEEVFISLTGKDLRD